MKEQFVPLAPDTSMVQALARGICPICTLMRSFQNAMVENAHRYPATRLCNFHAWSLAHASPAVDAVPILRAMLEEAQVRPASAPMELHPCDWCVSIREHEDEKLAEYSRELKRDNFCNWVTQYGTVCLFHGRRLVNMLPPSEAEMIRRMLATNKDELEKQLAAFEVRVRRGEAGGGGILGHIAEFLVSQRGLTR
jgi:hypothetical protein